MMTNDDDDDDKDDDHNHGEKLKWAKSNHVLLSLSGKGCTRPALLHFAFCTSFKKFIIIYLFCDFMYSACMNIYVLRMRISPIIFF